MISAFKHIRLSGYNLTPAVEGGKLRLGFGNSGIAYYSELTGVSGYLQSLIQEANANVDSINGLTGSVNIAGNDGVTIQVDAGLGQITVVGNSGYFQGLINALTQNLYTTGNTLSTNLATTGSTLSANLYTTGNILSTNLATTGSVLRENLAATGSTLQTNINTLSGYANATYVAKSSNQVFTTSLAPGADAYAINYPLAFDSTPKIQATLEVGGDVMYNLSINSIGTVGYTGLLSDNVLESNVKIHTFASTQ